MNTTRHFWIAAALFIGALVIVVCKAEPVSARNFLADADRLKKAQSLLEELPKFEGKSIQVFQSPHFNDMGNIVISLQDPNTPENVDEYVYFDGQWADHGRVQLTGDEKLEDNLTPLKEIPFATLATLFKVWEEKAKTVEGAEDKEMTHAYITIDAVTAERRWLCNSIDGSRSKYQPLFKLDGTIDTYEKL